MYQNQTHSSRNGRTGVKNTIPIIIIIHLINMARRRRRACHTIAQCTHRHPYTYARFHIQQIFGAQACCDSTLIWLLWCITQQYVAPMAWTTTIHKHRAACVVGDGLACAWQTEEDNKTKQQQKNRAEQQENIYIQYTHIEAAATDCENISYSHAWLV